MNMDADSHPPIDESPTELDHVTIEPEGAPNECAIFPREGTEEELMTNWISAHGEAFVSLETMR